MELTEEQIEFLNKVCGGREYWSLNSDGEVDVNWYVSMYNMKLTEIPVKFGRVKLWFSCSHNQLTTLKNFPTSVGDELSFYSNPLTDYFKNLKEEDFPYWCKLRWGDILEEYPFLVNIGKKYLNIGDLISLINQYPLTKLYLE